MSIFKILLGSGGPAKAPLMKIVSDSTKKPVKVKIRKFPAEKRNILDAYFARTVDMRFLKPYAHDSWQEAPYLVPKNSKYKFQTTIVLRPVNGVKKQSSGQCH